MDWFEGYDWTGIRIAEVVPVNARASERLIVQKANMTQYQLCVKFHGRTEMSYDGKPLLFDGGTVLYLPAGPRPDTPYRKYIRESGTGVCIFFTSEHPLPAEGFVIKNAGIPLELFTRVLTAWQTVGRELVCLGAFYTLLGELQNVMREREPRGGALDRRLLEARAYLDAHVSDPYMDIGKLAAFCGLSTEYFRQCFKKKWGVTPLSYLAGQKMARGRELLLGTSMSIGDIAERCGFLDANYFIRFFHRHEGITPGQYRVCYQKQQLKPK